MIYTNGGMTYWSKEAKAQDGVYILMGTRSLMLNVQPTGSVQYMRLDRAAFAPKEIRLPIETTVVIVDNNEALDAEFSAALSGLVLAKAR